MSEPLFTKRLHISGLTPSITPADLERRLSSFGKVKAMDGFGARDALGDPRKFGFVTMEIGTKGLAKCHRILEYDSYSSETGLNVLSGSTWKGAKLRIGEAKPDFRERLAQINTQPLRPVRPKRMRARNYGHPSTTLPLTPLSATAAASTPGWIVTPSGRVVRPIRMRPERPLEPMRSEPSASKVKGSNNKMKKRVKPPPERARRRLIDPTKWDSVYLKGMFLDNVSVPLPTSRGAYEPSSLVKHDILDEGDEEETDEDSADSNAESAVHFDHEDGMGLVARQRDVEMEGIDPPVSIKVPAQIAEPASRTNLGALFAPREDVSFSLLDHLDLDLDLDLDVDILGISAPPGTSQENGHLSEPVLSTPKVVEIPTKMTTKARSRVTLDPSHPLLFPSPSSLPHPYTPSNATTTLQHGIQACFLFPSATRSRGLHHLPSSVTFTRSPQDTSESIRERWGKDKSSLTREWKKAWRDARGSRRGKVGAGGEIGGGY